MRDDTMKDKKVNDKTIGGRLDCGIVRDLLPLYLDDVCCEESRKAVGEHLETCEECRKAAADMGVEYQVHIAENKEKKAYLEERDLFIKREKVIRKNVKLSIFDQFILIDLIMLLVFIGAVAGKFIKVHQPELKAVMFDLVSSFWWAGVIVVLGLLLEIIFFIGRYILKKEMHVTRIWIGWFLGVQILGVVFMLFFLIGIFFSVPAGEILKFVDSLIW